MSKLLHTPQITSTVQAHRKSFSATILLLSKTRAPRLPLLSSLHAKSVPLLRTPPSLSRANLSLTRPSGFVPPAAHRRSFSVRAFDDSAPAAETQKPEQEQETQKEQESRAKKDGDYPSGEFEFEEFGAWKKFGVKLKMLVAFPWERVKKGSVLTMKLRGQISDQLKSRFSSGLSLPQICENFIKAAYDPRISGIYLHIDSLNCGWGKVEEIRRHILNFKKSGLFDKVGIEPQVERIGKYKSAGDQLMRKSMSEENCEMLTTILDNIYGSWIDEVSSTKGKKREDIENFINEGVFHVERLKKEGFITDTRYDDEVITMLKGKLGVQMDKNLPLVDYRRYSRVRKWTLGLSGGKDLIAVIRASGAISRVKSPTSLPSSSGVIAEQIIEKIRVVRESKKFKAAIIRIDSPGGDALASDFLSGCFMMLMMSRMWREIRLLAESKPVIASMVDVAASGGYYMAMGTPTIVAESLTLTGSIGVVSGKLNLGNLYEKIGFNKEIISRGKYAELLAAEQRPFRPDEAELFAKMADNAYKMFRDKAAFSRSMPVDKMEEVAQGRVWTGNDAASRGLVDAIGGFSRAIAIAKEKANIPQTNKVTLVELSRPSPSLPEILSGVGSSLVGVDTAMKELLRELTFAEGVQARMDGILYEGLEGASFANPILTMIKDYLSSL
ncbi:serine protease SPPA, chloroplastic isoform X5 [Syzygium oleosum]|uniref:serine protease SPPA, chloroplastic isoform X5 n=1 Tax=Syzygium oleosum TaxID=219896 RepID=UPI0024BB07A2|nr:serine protease SPPA, chloroplastic isoform X5 [Syzygium oleosum]